MLKTKELLQTAAIKPDDYCSKTSKELFPNEFIITKVLNAQPIVIALSFTNILHTNRFIVGAYEGLIACGRQLEFRLLATVLLTV